MRFFLALILLCSPVTTAAQSPDDTLPIDPAVRTGTLKNGFTYYVRHNGRPEKRVLLRLAVKAGSLDEADDQQGLAHVLEHMAFNGTEHFEPGELVSYFERTGARLGPHVNAYTSFEATVYMLQLPTDMEGLVERGFTALADFAGGMTLDPAEIEKERGVVIEEWRSGLGAGSRLRDQQVPVLYHQSRYAERLPIGKPEVLRTFPPERLRAFYEAHYRPDRMAVVVVGDIEPARIESQIAKAFERLANPETPMPTRDDHVPLHKELLVNVASDPEAQRSSVSIVRKRPAGPKGSVADYRRSVIQRLVSQMIAERFDELTRRPDAAFLGAAGFGGALNREVAIFTLAASVTDGGIEAGLTTLAAEAQRLRRHGFGAAELERAKKWMLASFERAYNEREKTESSTFASAYVDHFLNDNPTPSIEYEVALARQLVPGITVSDVNQAVATLLADHSRVVLAVSPRKEGLAIPTEEALQAALKSGEAATLATWDEASVRPDLLEKTPEPGEVASRREIPELGVTVVRFANGVEAWLKPTDFKNDQVLFSFSAAGGSSLAPPEQYLNAVLAPNYVTLAGFAGLRAVDMPKILAGRLASAQPYIGLSEHGISGQSTPAELETALQLLYAQFTMPGDDPEAFALLRKQLDAMLANRATNPVAAFSDKVAEINSGGHYTSLPPTVERLSKLDRSSMLAFYRERFANAADFTLFMVGAFRVDEAVPLLARYVGSLPSGGTRASAVKDVGIGFPDAVVRARVEKGAEPRSNTRVTFFADPPLDEQEANRLAAAAEVLEIALRDILREELGQTYSVSTGFTEARPQPRTGRVVVSFGSAPENVDAMVKRVLEEVERLKADGPSEDLTNRVKESARRAHETSLKQNGYWLGSLQSKHMLGRDPLLILKARERIDAITPAALHETFKRYFPMDRYTVVSLFPEAAQDEL
jgi:zinc protease